MMGHLNPLIFQWEPKTINFPFGTNGKLIILGVPVLENIRVTSSPQCVSSPDLFNMFYKRVILWKQALH